MIKNNMSSAPDRALKISLLRNLSGLELQGEKGVIAEKEEKGKNAEKEEKPVRSLKYILDKEYNEVLEENFNSKGNLIFEVVIKSKILSIDSS